MNKLVFSLLLISLLALPAAAVNSCFEPTDLPALTFKQGYAPHFTVGADDRFYVGGIIDGLTNEVVYVNKNSAVWDRFVVPNMAMPLSLQAHPDASKASWVFAGSIAPSSSYAAYAATFDSQLWVIQPGTNGVTLQYYATSAPQLKSVLVVDSLHNKLYNFSASNQAAATHLSEIGTFSTVAKPSYVTASGSKVYAMDKSTKKIDVGVWDPSSSKYVFTLAGTAASANVILKLLAASNGKVYYGNSAGIVSNAVDVAEPPLFSLDGKFSDFLEYNNSIIAVSNGNAVAKADRLFGVYNGTAINYVLTNSTVEQPDFRPRALAVKPIEGKLYLLAYTTSAAGIVSFTIYKVKSTCLGFTVAPPVNNAPVISMEGGNVTAPVNTIITLTATASDPDGNSLNYTWAKLQGPVPGNLTEGGLNQSFVKYNFTSIGFYTFNVFVNDSGTPSLSATRNFTINITAAIPTAPARPAAPVTPAAEECTENSDCAANQMCNSDSECEALVCNDDETISDHECIAEDTGTLCGGEMFEGVGICCSGVWKADETTCPTVRNNSVGTRAGTNNTGSPQAILDNFTKNPTLFYGGIAIIVILLLVVVYFVFLKKKPPVGEGEETGESEAESTEEPQEPTS
ncbi:MAG: hypothetical protein V1722_00095 [Candidatus Micrarchaeota archaeon]